jgi:hypothetical protein
MKGTLRAIVRDARVEATAFLKWWGQELRDCGELVLGRIAPGLAQRVVVHLERPVATVYELRAARQLQALFTFSCDEQGAWPEQPEGFGSFQAARATLLLTPKEVLLSEWSLPEAVERELDRVIRLKLERELPLQPERVYHDHWIAARATEQAQMTVQVLVAHREHLERLRQLAQGWGIRPVRIALAAEPARPDLMMGNLLPSRTRLRRQASTAPERLLARAAVVVSIALLSVIAVQWTYERAKVGAEVQRVQTTAKSVRELTRRLAHEEAPVRALLGIQSLPDAADVLISLTETVPADSWVYDFRASAPTSGGAQLELSGFAPAATVLADELDKSMRFGKVRLVWATSAGLGTATDRLQLTALATAPGATTPDSHSATSLSNVRGTP